MICYYCSTQGVRTRVPEGEECCPRCFTLMYPDDFDADELGLDPEEEYDA